MATVRIPQHLALSLEAYIERISKGSFERGVDYAESGRVKDVMEVAKGRGSVFFGKVQGTKLYTTSLHFAEGKWSDGCTCPVSIHCKHVVALALHLVENAQTSGTPSARPASAASPAPVAAARPAAPAPAPAKEVLTPAEQDYRNLERILADRGQTYLDAISRKRLRTLCALMDSVRRNTRITNRDLEELGLVDTGRPNRWGHFDAKADRFEALLLSSPKDAFELAQLVLLHATTHSFGSPQVLQSLSAPEVATELRQRSLSLEQRREIARWQAALGDLAAELDAAEEASGAVDWPLLRLRFEGGRKPGQLVWEERKESSAAWRPSRAMLERLRRLETIPASYDADTRRLVFAAYAACPRDWDGSLSSANLALSAPPTLRLLRLLLLDPSLRTLLVGRDGEPFAGEPTPLVPGISRASGPGDVAEMRVEFEDGEPLSESALFIEGEPLLVIDGGRLGRCPGPLGKLLRGSVRIPTAALRAGQASAVLTRLRARVTGVDLPKVELLELHPRFVCRLVAVQGKSDATGLPMWRFVLRAIARDPRAGRDVKVWDGSAWLDLPGADAGAGVRVRSAGSLRSYWETWQEHEEAVTNRQDHSLSIDVGRDFPDEFQDWVDDVQEAGLEIDCDEGLAAFLRETDTARVTLEVSEVRTGGASDWFDLRLAVKAEDTSLTEAEVALLLKARGRFVLLPGKGFRRMALVDDAGVAEKAAAVGVSLDELQPSGDAQRFHALQLADERIAGLLPVEHAERARRRAEALRAIEQPPLPEGLQATLRPYQLEGFHFLAHLATNGLGGVLADDMGLGKTLQAITWLLWLASQREPGALRALVVCPKSVVPNWQGEVKRFAPSLNAGVIALGGIPRKAEVVVINYAQLRRSEEALRAVQWDAVILDEGQNIKNPSSQTARIARDLRALHRVILTGTPIENRSLDLWSLMAFAQPGLLGSQASFRRTFPDKGDPSVRQRLASRVRHFMLRRTKKQVAADLPERIEEDLLVDLDETQRALYDAELKRARQMLLKVGAPNELNEQRFNILQSLLRLRQICCDPKLVGFEGEPAGAKPRRSKKTAGTGEAASSADEQTGPVRSAKLTALLDMLQPLVEEGHRVLVFSQFVTMLDEIASALRDEEIPHLMLTGATENRQELVERFQSPAGEPVFLLSLKAAGAGLNLTAASYVVLYDPWWNPAVEAQAIDRTHRIGQVNTVIAYRLIARGTVEEKIRQLQAAKAELARSIVQEESLTSVLNLDDLRFVLG